MKKLILLGLLIGTSLLYSCKETAKDKKNDAKENIQKTYTLDVNKTSVYWTAYKTSDKVPVKGKFTEVTLENVENALSMRAALNGLKFTIPVSSIFSKDTIRDGKLKKFFFGVMKNTTLISGELKITDNSNGVVALTMNGLNKELPFIYNVSGKGVITILATMDLNNWNAQEALTSLNNACKDLHTGKDGVTKTWNDVAIRVVTHIK